MSSNSPLTEEKSATDCARRASICCVGLPKSARSLFYLWFNESSCLPFLRTLYERFIRTLQVFVSNHRKEIQWDRCAGLLRSELLLTLAITMLCAAGVVFYLRFLAALCKESRLRRFADLTRMRRGFRRKTAPSQSVSPPFKRDPQLRMQVIEIKLKRSSDQV